MAVILAMTVAIAWCFYYARTFLAISSYMDYLFCIFQSELHPLGRKQQKQDDRLDPCLPHLPLR